MPYKLLLADDSVTIQRVIELTFADEDVKVTAVGDGQTAIDRITADPPDIVLADVGMPARDGYEVAAFVKNTPDLAHIPVLLLTGAFEPVDDAKASAVRCNGVLAKPFEPQLLISRVKELLGTAGGAVPAETPESQGLGTDRTREDDETGPIPDVPPPASQAFTADDFSLDTAAIGEPSSATPVADISLDDYFDRLDAAFATLSGAPAGQLKGAVTPHDDTSWAPPASGGWSPADPAGLTTAHASGSGDASGPVPAAVVRDAVSVEAPAAVAAPVAVADAFAALLEAEQQGGAVPPAAVQELVMPLVPAAAPAAPHAAPVVTEALVDEVTRRVVERLGGGSLQDVVAKIVLETAERLVRAEIERLKDAASE
jgi:CheY-like chemotaxis protein